MPARPRKPQRNVDNDAKIRLIVTVSVVSGDIPEEAPCRSAPAGLFRSRHCSLWNHGSVIFEYFPRLFEHR